MTEAEMEVAEGQLLECLKAGELVRSRTRPCRIR